MQFPSFLKLIHACTTTAILIGSVKIMYDPSKYDVSKQVYDSNGRSIPQVTNFMKG
jgi:hypothetical protein